jgi:hypothetical protein
VDGAVFRGGRRAGKASVFEKMSKAERIELAKAKMERVLDHFLYVVELHANNSFVGVLRDTRVPNSTVFCSKRLCGVST